MPRRRAGIYVREIQAGKAPGPGGMIFEALKRMKLEARTPGKPRVYGLVPPR